MLKCFAALGPVVLLAAFGALHQQQTNAQKQTTQQNANNSSTNSTATPRLEFEVAVIKPSAPNAESGGMKADPGGQTVHAVNVPVRLMIESQWRINSAQVIGAPDWVSKDLWDVEAKADGPHNLEDLHVMYQNMMADRFKMQFHWDTRDLPMFALVLDKSGPKMTVNTGPEAFDIRAHMVAFGKLQGNRCDLKYFTWLISLFPWVGRPVVDETGLDKSKFYDFTLLFEPEIPEGVDRSKLPPAPGPDFFTAIREQLGLRLEAKKGPVPVMVIDHIEQPSSSDNYYRSPALPGSQLFHRLAQAFGASRAATPLGPHNAVHFFRNRSMSAGANPP